MSRSPLIPHRVAFIIPMLGATIDAEVLAARNALVRALAVVGLDLNDLAAAIPTVVEPTRTTRRPMPGFFDMSRACRDLDGGQLGPREREFVAAMCQRGSRVPSPGQARWLTDIFDRLTRRAA